jgi:hypothetical protein
MVLVTAQANDVHVIMSWKVMSPERGAATPGTLCQREWYRQIVRLTVFIDSVTGAIIGEWFLLIVAQLAAE